MSKELIEQLGLGHTNSNMFERNDLGLPKSVKGTVNHFFFNFKYTEIYATIEQRTGQY